MLQIPNCALASALEGDGDNLPAVFKPVRMTRRHVTEESVDGREPDIASGRAVVTLLLQVSQKRENLLRVEILEVQKRDAALLLVCDKPQ